MKNKKKKNRVAIICIHTCVHNNIKFINHSSVTITEQNL